MSFTRAFKKGKVFSHIDWALLFSAVLISAAGLVTMSSFSGESPFEFRQLIWLAISIAVFFFFSFIDWRFLRKTHLIFILYILSLFALGLLFLAGTVSGGAQSWFRIGAFSIQPADPAKLVIVMLLAKYFSRRHIEIRRIKHILISGAYALAIFLFIVFQPDFGSAVIVFLIWLGMVLVSGISKKHLLALFAAGAVAFVIMWSFVFAPYQKSRIISFIDPLADIQGAGYNAFQSMIAVGSGGWFGKGVGYGTQSRLEFLPEYQTDFIFAAYAEEWGFVGAFLMLALFGVVIYRILKTASKGETNFEILFGVGVAIFFISHILVHVGMNLGLLPVTGTPLPFASYGGSHLLTEFAALGILAGMARYARPVHREILSRDLLES